ncbi:cell filamentation protein Fic, partial [Rhodococcus aetherivorans]
ASNPLLGDLREQFVWGRFEYMQTGDTRLMCEVLDIAITDPTDPLPVGPIIDHGVDLRATAAATLGHPRPVRARTPGAAAPDTPAATVDLPHRHHTSHDLDP